MHILQQPTCVRNYICSESESNSIVEIMVQWTGFSIPFDFVLMDLWTQTCHKAKWPDEAGRCKKNLLLMGPTLSVSYRAAVHRWHFEGVCPQLLFVLWSLLANREHRVTSNDLNGGAGGIEAGLWSTTWHRKKHLLAQITTQTWMVSSSMYNWSKI